MPRNTNPAIQKTPEAIRSDIRAIIKLMIGEVINVDEQPRRLESKDLALDMRNCEGHVLDAIYWCVESQFAPTRDAVVRCLEINQRLGDEIDPGKYVDDLIEENKDDVHGIKTLSAFVQLWMNERKLEATGQATKDIANDLFMDYGDKWEAAFSMLMNVSPSDNFIYDAVQEKEFRALVRKTNQEVVALRKAGQDIGPQFPFEAFKAYFGALKWGEVSLLLGREGSGKTSVVSHLEENIATRQKLKCDVIHISLETPLEVLSLRQFARHTLVPYSAVSDGLVDISDEKWKPFMEPWEKVKATPDNEYGYIRHFYSPDASVTDIIAAMQRSSETSLALGHRVFFVIDHLHKVNWKATHKSDDEFGALRSITIMLGAAANKLSIRNKNHLMIVGQQGDERGQLFGGKFSAKVAQYVFSTQRERFGSSDSNGIFPPAPESLMMMRSEKELTPEQRSSNMVQKSKDNPGMYVLLDRLGKPRYWYRRGDEFSHKMHIYITKGNDNATGVIDLLFEPEMSRITQDPDQVRSMRSEGRLPPLGV